MTETIIKVENLGKKYTIGHQSQQTRLQSSQAKYSTLRDTIANNVKALKKNIFELKQTSSYVKEEFWALKDINFEIKRGEVVGIIGRNGAGKSTLLKILSRITEPTIGRIELRGRVASLLEVGTGFHPELTGRENIYLNGSILGMSRVELRRKFDEIVDFAEIETFLDTPVKRYSSGMYVRLAFAVAAHLEPEVLIVDEVLAVGDVAFQKKCLGKMGDVAKQEGRTVLFVSHNMAAVQKLCSSSILLNQGRIKNIGPTSLIIDEYNRLCLKERNTNFIPKVNTSSYIQDVKLRNLRTSTTNFSTDQEIFIDITIFGKDFGKNTDLLLFLHPAKINQRLFLIEENLKKLFSQLKIQKETLSLTIILPSNFLMPGDYSIEIGILDSLTTYSDHHAQVASFHIFQGSHAFLKYGTRNIGMIFSNSHKVVVNL